jgi:hypothetical protein
MSTEHNETDSECHSDEWLTLWEKKCLDEWEKECALEERLQAENERTSQKMWQSFQNAATAVSRLFTDGSQGGVALWAPFQNAAGSVALLYRDSQESLRRSFELGVQFGIHRHTRELLAWSKKRRRRIARDDLIAHLCGKSVPSSSRLRAVQSQFAKTPVKSASSTSTVPKFGSVDGATEPDLQLFQDAVHGLSGAMSNVSVGRRLTPPLQGGTPVPVVGGATDEYRGFLLEQIANLNSARKRSATTMSMDTLSPSSPSLKRFRMDDNGDL